jgi:hypothetical protein
MMISAPMDKTIFVNPPEGILSPAASHVEIGVSLEFLTTFFEDTSHTIQDVWYNHSKAYSGLNSRILENMQLYIQVLQYDVIVLHNGLYLLSHNIYWD